MSDQIEGRELTRHNALSVYHWIERNTDGSFEPLSVIDGEVPIPHSGVSVDPRDGSLIIAQDGLLMKVRLGDYVMRFSDGSFGVLP